MHLLIAEDSPVSREILRQILSGFPAHVSDFAADGEEAWALLQNQPDAFDAVILDVAMPGLDGFDVLKRMRSHPILRTTPVILCTALGDRISVAQAASFSVEHYIIKPYARKTLVEKLDLVENRQARPLCAEPAASVCERLGVTLEGLEALRRTLNAEVKTWMSQAAAVGSRTGICKYLLAANGLRGSASTLGSHELAEALLAVEVSLERLDEDVTAFPRAIFPGMIEELLHPVAALLKAT